ncbi:hypothetical protein NUW58_g4017 [Xylaria curta]|uniref:Uncharacterized protein n=1 Tax=Xylaria curta TaxID=42375 RepID=A0ACC1PAZ8_9PEZI|nr:hypothetical protein NUW58_g4017 [Xylaria curta]
MYSILTGLIALGSLFTTGSATCYLGGQDGDNGARLRGIDGITTACEALIGTYIPGESRHFCLQVNGTKWDFFLKCVSYSTSTIQLEECMNGMGKEAYGCRRGGYSNYWTWAYTADPNAGFCSGGWHPKVTWTRRAAPRTRRIED